MAEPNVLLTGGGDTVEYHRLLQHVHQSIYESESQKSALKDTLSQYQHLSKELTTISKNISCKAMLPFSTKAFIPGKIINTNQVTVYLGSQHFALVSTSQAQEIIDRRTSEIEKRLEDISRQTSYLTSQAAGVSSLGDEFKRFDPNNADKNSSDVFEIREEYNEETEMKWMRRHTENLKKETREMNSLDVDAILNAAAVSELAEVEGQPDVDTISSKEHSTSQGILKTSFKGNKKTKKRVSFSTVELSKQEDVSELIPHYQRQITFAHTSHPQSVDNETPLTSSKSSEFPVSPADLVQMIQSNVNSSTAIQEHIVERIPSDTFDSSTLSPAPSTRPVSKFKALRQRS